MVGFIIWAFVGCIIMGIGIHCFFAKEAVGFWANVKMFQVTDVRKYNFATGKLFLVYGAVFILLGLPLLGGQNSPYIILSILGVMLESIVLAAVYSLVIQKKYEKK